jgi:serpin B
MVKHLIGLAVFGVLVGTAVIPAVPPAAGQAATDQATVVRASNQLALDLYGAVRTKGGNLFFSPYSISTALAMTYAGAKGDTAKEMAQTLRFPLDQNKLHPAVADLMHQVQGAGKKRKAQLVVANALWGQQNYHFLPGFLQVTRDHYNAGLREVDFINATDSARRTINDWVEGQTQNKIKELLQPGIRILNPNTRLVLTNAIYFKAAWARPFPERNTRDETFFADGKSATVKMMHGGVRTKYARFGDLQVLELPYEANELSMLAFLPRKGGLAAFEKTLTPGNLAKWQAKLSDHQVDVKLPKFEVMSEFRLDDALKALGMKRAFDGRADFSGMTSQERLFLGAVVHKAFLDVNEQGTEAAAATAAVVKARSVGPSDVRFFRADHPFVFLIRDTRSGCVLFLGRLADPGAGPNTEHTPRPREG